MTNKNIRCNEKTLQQFLYAANITGYASGNEKNWIKEIDGSTTIIYEQGKFKFHDNFFGGEPYGGRIIVSYAARPIWIMVYYGETKEKNLGLVYNVLRHALLRTPENLPLRGPEHYQERNFIYSNFPFGRLTRFCGIETITKNNQSIYQANYSGGLVDVRKGI